MITTFPRSKRRIAEVVDGREEAGSEELRKVLVQQHVDQLPRQRGEERQPGDRRRKAGIPDRLRRSRGGSIPQIMIPSAHSLNEEF